MLKIAVVEDEADLREEFCDFLRLSGMEAEGLGDGAAFAAYLERDRPDAVILDINLPDEDGFSIAARLRDRDGVGVVMVTSRAGLDDRVRGLRTGADAYLVKPVDLEELVATLESVCRRLHRLAPQPAPASASAPESVDAPGWSLGRLGWELIGPTGRTVTLTAAEHDFLARLVATPGQPVARSELLGRGAGADAAAEGDLRRLDAVVRRLRRKVEAEIGRPLPVRSVHGVGYATTDMITIHTP